jgi:tetratricopeptide (TPR) repeat protein
MTSSLSAKPWLPAALGVGALFFAVLLPPEAYPDGKMAVILCATFAFLAALAARRISANYLAAGVAVFGYLILHSLLISVDMYRSLEFVTVLWAYYCLFGLFIHAGPGGVKAVAIALVVISAIVAGYGIYQYFWGFEVLEQLIMHSGSDEIVKAPALSRVATRRIFSTLALPGTLWGFLVMALPFHLMLMGRRRAVDVALVAGIALSLTAGFLTRSFGLLIGLTVASCCWLLASNARAAWKRLIVVMLAAGVCGTLFYSARRVSMQNDDPMALRFLNWVSAWQAFSTHPMGTGLNTFGVVYTQHMMPGANETQYAHNTPLQLMAELGYPVLLAGAIAIIVLARRRRAAPADEGAQRALAAALAVWALHNAIDIDVYFPSVGVVGIVILALFLRRFYDPSTTAAAPARALTGATGVMSAAVVVFAAAAFVSGELKQRAQAEYQEKKPLVAIESLKLAQTIMPLDSSLFHDAGDILLDVSQKKPEYLEAATASFQRAIALSPLKVGPHIGYGLCLSTSGNVDAALEQVAVAKGLYPRSTYVRAIEKLMTQRKEGMRKTANNEGAATAQ